MISHLFSLSYVALFLDTYSGVIESVLLWYFSIINILYTFFLVLGSINVLFRINEVHTEDVGHVLKSDSLPSILFILPMFNEGSHIEQNIDNILSISYRQKHIIAVNDGSTDNTMEILSKKYSLVQVPKYYEDKIETKPIKAMYRSASHPDVYVIDKENGGKFDAINAAINATESPLFIVLDADTFVDGNRFLYLVRPLLTESETIGAGASIRIMNGCDVEFNRIKNDNFPRKFLPALQGLEYLRAFCLRDGLDLINGNFIVSGAFSVFPRKLILEIGGFGPTKGEDVEIIVRLHRIMRERKQKYNIKYFPDPVAYTLAPENLKELGQQRTRWHVGLLDSIWCHKKIFLNPKYGLFGNFIFPFWVLGEALEPIFEFLVIVYIFVTLVTGRLNIGFTVLFFAVTCGYTAIYSIYALFIKEFSFDKLSTFRKLYMFFTANFLENLGYRQTNLWWRFKALLIFVFRIRRVHTFSKFINELVQKADEQFKKRQSEKKNNNPS